MADDATIQAAVETLQRALSDYAEYEGPVDGNLTPELYDLLATFTDGFQNIGGVATILNSGNIEIEGIYDPALGEALQSYFGGDALNPVRNALANPIGGERIARGLLSMGGAPEVFINNPNLLLQFADTDLSGIVEAINTLEADGLLDARPQELTQEQIEAQPAAIEAMETIIRDDLTYFRDYSQGRLDALQAQLDELPDDADGRVQIEVRMGTYERTIDLLNGGLERIENLDPDTQPDPNFQEALRVYVEFLQRGHTITAYMDGSENTSNRIDPDDVVDGSGNYTQEYEDFLLGRLEQYESTFEELEAIDARSEEQEFQYQLILRTRAFTGAMEEMVESGAYIHPAAPGSDDAPEEPEVMPIEEARPIIEQAIRHMWETQGVEVTPVLGEEDDWEFEFASRIALQAFLIDLKGFLNIDVDGEAGVYSRELRVALAEAFENADTRRSVANRYFRGEEAMVLQLLQALNTYADPAIVPDLTVRPSNIEEDALITFPDLRENEAAMMSAAIDRMPDNELLAMNEIMITLTGYGMEDFMPEGTFSEEQAAILELGGDRSEILGDFFTKIRQEAYDALVRDGRPLSELETEIQERMVERFNNLVGDNAAFDVIRVEFMRDYIRRAASDALAAEASTEGNPQNIREAAGITFADGIPGAVTFAENHGPNMRAYFIVDPNEIEGVTPEIMRGFGGEIAGETMTLEQARSQQTMAQLITDMEQDFERLESSAIAMRTMREVRSSLEETRGLMERIYNDPRNAGSIMENGDLIVRSLQGETVLLSQGGDGLEIRYLDALGIEAIEGIDNGSILEIGEEFDLDALLIRTASAGYQSLNDGAQWRENHNPEFFELNGRHYVVGMDGYTNTIQVEALDEEFLTASNAARRVYSLTSESATMATDEAFLEDDAYRFLQENYGLHLRYSGSADSVLHVMLHQVGSVEAQTAIAVMGEYHLIDYANQPELADAPIVDDPSILSSIAMVNGTRPDEEATRPFIYLREGEDGSPQILVVSPSLREVLVTNEDGTQEVTRVLDSSVPATVRDISDPDLYQGMRDLFLSVEVLPEDVLENPAFQELHDWLISGGRPVLRETESAPDYGPATEEGLASLFASASGFTAEGRDIAFGQAIAETETLVEVLGYDPNAAFVNGGFSDPENSYLIHGLEPVIWQGSEDHHEFLQDHFLITFMRDGEVVTVAMEKEDVNNNPYRIPDMLRFEHDVEETRLSPPVIFGVNRDMITTSSEGIYVPPVEFRYLIEMDPPEVIMRQLEDGEPYSGQIEEQGFWNDMSWWDMRQQWRIDAEEWRRSLHEDDGASLDTPTNEDMLRECIAEMTCDHQGALTSDDRSMVASLTPGAAVRPDA